MTIDYKCLICGHHRTSAVHKKQHDQCSKKQQQLAKQRTATAKPSTPVLPFMAKRNQNGTFSKTEFY